MPRTTCYRAISVLLAAAATITLSMTAPAQGLSSAAAAVRPTSVPAGRDYATTTFGDPWDYSNPSDLVLDDGPTKGLTGANINNGMLNFTTSNGYISPLWGGYSMEVPVEREGTRAGNALNASTYTHMKLHIYVGHPTSVVLSWYTCGAMRSACNGYMFFNLAAGWNDIDKPVVRYGATVKAWSGQIVGLLMGLRSPSGLTSFHMDSLRFYQPASASVITWAAPGASPSTLWWTDSAGTIVPTAGQHAGPVPNVARSTNSSDRITANVAGYAPGTMFWSVAADGSKTLLGATSPAPVPVVDTPSAAGCSDYATRYLGHPWTFTSARSILWYSNMTALSYTSAGELSATNTGPVRSDPQMLLPIPAGGIPGQVYHRLTVTESYDGPFNLTPNPGGGAMGRILWTSVGHIAWAQTAPLVTFTGKRSLTFDMAMPTAQLIDPTSLASQRYAFASTSAVTRLRWDANEDPGAKRWHLYSVQLKADCQAVLSFPVSWHDNAYSAGSTVAIQARTASGATYPLGTAKEHSGLNTLVVPMALPRGTYTVVVYVTNAAGVTIAAASSGPLVRT
jgi:hypothetical protein